MIQTEHESLAKSAKRGVTWLSGSNFVSQAMTFVITIILARVLAPDDYGLLGMVTVILIFMGRFADFGTGSAIIQQSDLSNQQLSSIFWFNVMIGSTLGLLLFVLSPIVALFYKEPNVQALSAVLALKLPLQALAITPEFLLRRQLKFKQLVFRNIGAVLIGGIFGIAMALNGYGVWALVAQQLSQAVSSFLILWLTVKWRPLLEFHLNDILIIRKFMSGVIGFNLLNFFARNIDYLLIGRFLGAGPLGLYTLAYRLMRYPIQTFSGVASQTLFPVFSRMGSDENRISNAYLRVVHYIALVTFPIMMVIAITSENLIVVLFKPHWLEAAPLLSYLSIAAIVSPLTALYTPVIWAKGYTQWHLKYAVVQSGIIIIGFFIGLQWGVKGIAISFLFGSLISNGITIFLMFPKCNVSRLDFLKGLVAPTLGTISLITVIFLLRYGLRFLNLTPESPLVTLILEIVVSGITYFPIVFLINGDLRGELVDAIRKLSEYKKNILPSFQNN